MAAILVADNLDVVFVDLYLDGPGGWYGLREIKSRAPPHYKTPMIFRFCSHSTEGEIHETLNA